MHKVNIDGDYRGTFNVNERNGEMRVSFGGKPGGTRKPRTKAFGTSDTLVTRADGSQYIIPRHAKRAESKRVTRKRVAEQRIIETVRATVSYDQRHREQY